MLWQNDELARLVEGGIIVRPQPLRLVWSFDDLVSADGHSLKAVFSCSARALNKPAELHMLAETFLGGRTAVTAGAVVEHFRGGLRSALSQACELRGAAQSLGQSAELIEPLRAAARRIAFSCGLEMLPPFDLQIQSPSLERQRLESMQRSLAEQRAAGQIEHMQRAAELLRQFQAVRDSAPQLSAGEVLRQLAPSDQAAVLQTLLMAAAGERPSPGVWVVAGGNLLRIDHRTPGARTQTIAVPGELGPLRSVQLTDDRSRLLIGARGGVIQLDANGDGAAVLLHDPSVVSQLGFSRAIAWRGWIWACHSEAGVVGWDPARPLRPDIALRPVDLLGAMPRNLQPLDEGRLVFSAGNRLMVLTVQFSEQAPSVRVSSAPPDADATIVAVLSDGPRLLTVLENGVVQVRDRASLELMGSEQRCGQTTAAALLPWLGSTRLLLASADAAVLCIGLDDQLVTQFISPYRGLRALAAGPDVVAGLSADRQRVVLWRSWDGRQPLADVYVTALARHRAAAIEV